MKKIKVVYYIGLVLSMLVGIWHFFVPYMFHWRTYIPNEYENLFVSIEYLNFCFSLLLTGFSLLIIMFGKKVLNGNKDAFVFYGFFVFVWLCRAAISFVFTFPVESNALMVYGQQVATFIIFIMLVIPFLWLTKRLHK